MCWWLPGRASPELETDLDAGVRIAAAQQRSRKSRAYVTHHLMGCEVRVSVLVPTMNEERNLPIVLPRIPLDIDEIVIVDGRSTDGTRELARRLCPDAVIIEQTGFRQGRRVAQRYRRVYRRHHRHDRRADGSNDPAEIPAFVGALRAGADFAKGSRFLQGAGTADMPLHRRLGNKLFVVLVRVLFRARYSDLCYGFNAFWADAVQRLDLDADGFEIETMMNIRALRAGLRIVEVASFEHERKHGDGRLKTIPDGWRVLKTIFAERLRRPSGGWSGPRESLATAEKVPAES